MEENKGTCGCENKGMCGGMRSSMCCRKHLCKKIFMIIAMLFMFWVGLQLGELRTLVKMEGTHGDMMMSHRMMGMGGDQGGMGMWGNADQTGVTPDQTTTVAPATK